MDDPKPDERTETVEFAEFAEFAPARVGGSRHRHLGPIIAAAWVMVLAAVVGVGFISHGGSGSSVPTQAPAALHPEPSAVAKGPPPVAGQAPSRPSDPNLIAIQVAAAGRGIAVSGIVRSRSVVSVLVSVEYADGSVSWQSLGILDGGLQAVSGPSFVAQFDLADPLAAVVWVEANAYNGAGRKISSVRQPIGPPTAHEPVRAKTSLLR